LGDEAVIRTRQVGRYCGQVLSIGDASFEQLRVGEADISVADDAPFEEVLSSECGTVESTSL